VTHAFPPVHYAHYCIELTAAQNHKDPATLDNASQLVWQLNRIPRVVQRMECHEIAFSWPAAANSAASQLGVIECACQELGRSQENMRQLLSIVLSVGNYLNGGTPRGQVRGFIYCCYKCTTIMCLVVGLPLSVCCRGVDNRDNAFVMARDSPHTLHGANFTLLTASSLLYHLLC
jgi:hypothetical protein